MFRSIFKCNLVVSSLTIVLSCYSVASAQMIFQEGNFQNSGDAFSESTSVGGFLRGDNWFFNFGGPPLIVPFGPDLTNAGSSVGFGFGGGGFSGGLSLNMAQASSRSMTSASPSVTTMDRYPGSIQSGTIRPFVTGFIPVVSDFPRPDNSEAAQNQRQLAELRQSQRQLQDERLQTYLQRIRQAEASGNVRMAKANYRSAIAITGGPLQTQLKQNLRAFMVSFREKQQRSTIRKD